MEKQNVLRDAQDIAFIKKSGEDSYVYAAKPSLSVQRQFYEQSVSNPADREVPAFRRYWEFDSQKGILGSSTFLALRLDKQVLRPLGLWLPGLLEAKVLGSQGKLENGVYRDHGVVVYDESNPNKEIAKVLVPQARELGLELPLIFQFRALNQIPMDNIYGLGLSFADSPRGILLGQEAQEQIDSLDYKTNSGLRRLSRNGDGDWDVSWSDLDNSDDYGRVDWVCGEATRADLEEVHEILMGREYSERIRVA